MHRSRVVHYRVPGKLLRNFLKVVISAEIEICKIALCINIAVSLRNFLINRFHIRIAHIYVLIAVISYIVENTYPHGHCFHAFALFAINDFPDKQVKIFLCQRAGFLRFAAHNRSAVFIVLVLNVKYTENLSAREEKSVPCGGKG